MSKEFDIHFRFVEVNNNPYNSEYRGVEDENKEKESV